MAPSQRPDHHINLNYLPQLTPGQSRSGSSTAATSPIEPPTAANTSRYQMGGGSAMSTIGNSVASTRMGAGSPSHDYSGRLLGRRAREIQAQEGLSPQVWGPPTSGNSTPLRETIPESPNGDSFPDFNAPTEQPIQTTSTRRTRAGTLPSRFSTAGVFNGLNQGSSSLLPQTSRPTPSTSPFKPGSHTPTELGSNFPAHTSSAAPKAPTMLSRLRAGSMPQRPAGFGSSNNQNPFGSSLFSSGWGSTRERSSTLASIRSSDAPSSPAHSQFSRESLDNDVRTLDYLGLVDTPQQPRATLAPSDIELMLENQRAAASYAALNKSANRFRSYSVNAKEKYADEEDEELDHMGPYGGHYSGTLTPTAEASAAAYANIHEAVRQHNLEVQAFANFASANRPRARTAGVLESPSTRLLRSYLPTPSRLGESSLSGEQLNEEAEYSGLTEAVQGLNLNGKPIPETQGEDNTIEGPTRALWLGNIPSSTTVSSLNVIFNVFGAIESTRVLTHKNCGFVNFENLESAVRAKQQLNGKEIFPGAGPVRIGYAKVPSAAGTPGANGLYPSPSPDPNSKIQGNDSQAVGGGNNRQAKAAAEAASAPLATPVLSEVRGDIVQIVKDLGANDEEAMRISAHVEQAIDNDDYHTEIPPIPEPSHNRVHDAPRLREIRKRIDNNSCTQGEIEDVALAMLPEVAELSSDYLGNTVVQKLFEYCSETVKEAMLNEIAPHLAEIGVHKNGTWAAQKIIDVARTPVLMKMVVDALRPYGMALFLDQFGNYVMQGCLRYQYPINNFIFEVMLSRLWDLAQGRFGARAMRACLESHFATKDQQRMIAAAIALHSVHLATNANGALLLTWFLDTCTFPRRRTVLAPRLVPHLVHLCTHKVAYLTVLKIINQRNEPEARDAILQALFFSPNDQVLEAILSDQSCGATLIFKVLTTPFFDEKLRPDVVQNVRNVLLRIKAQPAQGYKRLMDEVGLSTRSGGRGGDNHARDMSPASRPGSKHANASNNQNMHQQATNAAAAAELNRGQPFFPPGMPQAPPGVGPFDLQRTASMDSQGFEQPNAAFLPYGTASPNLAQLQYQQAMLAAQGRQPSAFGYPPAALGGMGVGGMGVGVNGFPATTPGAADPYRGAAMAAPGLGLPTGSPMMPQASFGQPMLGVAGFPQTQSPYGYPPMGFASPPMGQQQPQQQQQGAAAGGRRGRCDSGKEDRFVAPPALPPRQPRSMKGYLKIIAVQYPDDRQ
ncbi:uncharacterized protein K452DRAFT_296310 [Aplosporella prunicola CBS 121167]|uniref:PUM-HD domain-containing protein n=1 Tax=Aplosporella prunicola CBS 121167 TaxID=1176127 RepID=A0A6A6BK89_9PEZI|nr:uncharacterized protein K452DRAFT_296310 [Aplosporella prunicola CBS 121167]KAF2144058.1 hypothetical protein K452DRAFT_296310 [Aplosporella prunicola CBS 121167]